MADDTKSKERFVKEIALLREKVRKLEADQEDTTTHRIYVEARRRLLAFVSVGVIVVTAFGLVSVSKLIDSIEKQVQDRGVESIIGEIKTDFSREHTGTIIETIRAESSERLEQVIYTLIRDELNSRLAEAAEVTGEKALASEIRRSYEGDRYLVIGGSSVKRIDLERELTRVKNGFGDEFLNKFAQARIYPPKSGKRHYALVISHGLSHAEAQEVLKDAIDAGFRSDSYVGLEAKTSVDLSNDSNANSQ